MTSKMTALQGEAHFFEESMNPAKVKEYLSRPKVRPTACIALAIDDQMAMKSFTSIAVSRMVLVGMLCISRGCLHWVCLFRSFLGARKIEHT